MKRLSLALLTLTAMQLNAHVTDFLNSKPAGISVNEDAVLNITHCNGMIKATRTSSNAVKKATKAAETASNVLMPTVKDGIKAALYVVASRIIGKEKLCELPGGQQFDVVDAVDLSADTICALLEAHEKGMRDAAKTIFKKLISEGTYKVLATIAEKQGVTVTPETLVGANPQLQGLTRLRVKAALNEAVGMGVDKAIGEIEADSVEEELNALVA